MREASGRRPSWPGILMRLPLLHFLTSRMCPDSRMWARLAEVPAVLVHCRVSDPDERVKLRDEIRDKVRAITGMNCVVELVPPRTLPRTSSGKLSRAKARKMYLAGEIEPYQLAA